VEACQREGALERVLEEGQRNGFHVQWDGEPAECALTCLLLIATLLLVRDGVLNAAAHLGLGLQQRLFDAPLL
jgi:hypothetical protein